MVHYIMEPTMIQKKKHLLLLNRIIRAETKKDIIQTPSKLTEEDINKYFKMLFIEKDGYFAPIKNKLELKVDEELFKGLIKQPKMKAMKPMKEPKIMEDKEAMKEMKKQKEKEDELRIVNLTVNKIYKDLINPYVAKKKAGDKAEAEESALLKKFFQVSNNVRNEIKKISPKLYDNFLKPKYDEYMMRKDKLSMESKQQMKDIRKSAQEEKRMLKKKIEE
jgi:hypothetical protein